MTLHISADRMRGFVASAYQTVGISESDANWIAELQTEADLRGADGHGVFRLLLPLGGIEAGFKGYGLSLVIGLLAGTLNQAAMGREVIDFNKDDHSVTNTGHAIVAIDPASFGDPDRFKGEVDRLIREIRASKRLPGVERVWLPGEKSQTKRIERMKNGIPVPQPLLESLNKTAAELGIEQLA